MENASKALLIAGAVLVVIIIIALGLRIFSKPASETQKVAQEMGQTINEKTLLASDVTKTQIEGKLPMTEEYVKEQIKSAYQEYKNSSNISRSNAR